MPPVKAIVFAPLGPALGEDERAFFAAHNPLGFILMGRNCVEPGQVRRLVAELRETVGRADAPVMIDQEGGRVARLRPPHWRAAPPAARFGALAEHDSAAAAEAARLNARLIAAELIDLGITVDCAPVVDVPAPGGHEIIGDRAFAADPERVSLLGRAVCEGLIAGGVAPVLKHTPGHGAGTGRQPPGAAGGGGAARGTGSGRLRALPRAQRDAVGGDRPCPLHRARCGIAGERLGRGPSPRRSAATSASPASWSPTISAWPALSGTMGSRAAAVIAAGCDVALHCSGEPAEMAEIAAAVGAVTDGTRERLARSAALVPDPDDADLIAMAARLDGLLDAAERRRT